MITDKIYVAIIVEIVLQALILIVAVAGIVLRLIKSKSSRTDNSMGNNQIYYGNQSGQNYYGGNSGNVTYCRNCAGEYGLFNGMSSLRNAEVITIYERN